MRRRFTRKSPPILTLGTIAATGLVLSGCGDEEPREVLFSTPQQCAESGIDTQICEAEYQQALQTHLQSAPKYDAMEACEAEYGEGRCFESGGSAVGQQGGGGFFVPFMTGYVLSSALSNLSYSRYRSDYRYGPSYVNTPVYRTRTGNTVTSTIRDGQSVTRPVNVNTRTVSRSGFGGRSSSRGFFGG
ncbi:DUF1190 domain-containing protein [Jiella marina]|uniref:DUF1190 domain-containing protein n=1 Tax=Jiella sp. LLJ827 TaxID=2917712 RepID=UPI002100DF20|nr:DUF1190 domain-containing protein [Jiella sp. LLJ827]MCQ0987709.1 DUF1190 domain-containing protein [Jiella sp. LLJ827]